MSTEAQARWVWAGGVRIPAVLLTLAVAGWWWSARMAGDMAGDDSGMAGMAGMAGMGTSRSIASFGAFMLAWLAMMAAMMLPALSPVVRLYSLAAARGGAAPLPFFVGGYIVVWTALGIPAYFAWRALMGPIAEGSTWAARLAGLALLLAAIWQMTPLKSVCLRRCRSPLSVFLRVRGSLGRPKAALRLGSTHGLYCLGCCWALMAVLVAVGTMNVAWMIGLTVLIVLEKSAPWGEGVAKIAAVVLVTAGVALIAYPPLLIRLT